MTDTERNRCVDAAAEKLAENRIHATKSALLSAYTTFRLGGPTPLLIDCSDENDLTKAVEILNQEGIKWKLIGGGSNLLVSDAGVESAIIRFVDPAPRIQHDNNRMRVSAAASLDAAAAYCCANGLADFVKASGIPGTVGGAIVGNAGAFGWQVGDALESLEILEPDATRTSASPADLAFAYRDSALKNSGRIVLSATFLLEAGAPADLHQQRAEILALRKEKHPDLAVDSCAGSFFRNIEPTSKADRRQAAGWFLEQAGAKNMEVGGARLFCKHANIPIKGSPTCTASDVNRLTKQMATAVKDRFNITLIREVQLVGEFTE